MPDLKVERFMPVVIERTTHLVYQQFTKSIIRTEDNLRTYLSSLIIYFKSALFMIAYFYKLQIPFTKSASKILSHIQSTAQHIFLQAPYFWERQMRHFLMTRLLGSLASNMIIDKQNTCSCLFLTLALQGMMIVLP